MKTTTTLYEQHIKTSGSLGQFLYPLMLGDKEVYIDKQGKIENPEVFKAVCNGFHIDLRDIKDEEGGSKIIDI